MRKNYDFIFYILGFALWFYLERNYPRQITFSTWTFLFVSLFFFAQFFKFFNDYLKHHSPQFISREVHNSIVDEVVNINGFSILRLGGSDVEWWGRIPGKDAVVVVPTKLVHRLGRNFFADVQLIKLPNVNYLPVDIATYLKKNGIRPKEYYFGVYPLLRDFKISEEVDLNDLSLKFLTVNELIDLYEQRFSSIDSIVNFIERTVKSLRRADEK